MFRSLLLSMVSFGLVGSLLAAVPNSFTDGQVVSAAKINENFTAASNKIVFKVNGTTLSGFVFMGDNQATVYSKNLYYVALSSPLGTPAMNAGASTFYFTDGTCGGTPYTMTAVYGQLFKVTTSSGDALYYVDKAATSRSISPASYSMSGTCYGTSGSMTLYPVTANSESVTGFPNFLGSTLSFAVE